MNKMKEVAKLLGCELGEEFNLIFADGKYSRCNPFKFTEKALVDKDNGHCNSYVVDLITGFYTIEKIPFVPKIGEKYFSYGAGIEQPYIDQFVWGNVCYDRERKLLGIVFRTEHEALNYLPTWEKRLEGEEV